MKTIQKAITGNENFNDLKNPIQVLAQFYSAFNNQDFELMSQNWLQNEDIAMDNPLGGIKRGWDEIKSVYSRIFNGKAKVYVEFYDYTIVNLDGGFCAIGRERGYVQINEQNLELAIRTSRVFKLINRKYKQVHHHGSIETPQLLKEYQELVK
ncbi:nuclear transport factor 2 family protein [Sulfurovum sp.]|uniref:YybH family protein n=1 Tax=Sulfurovum sp. TaxID=1969726 RepID=UPI0025D31077|nr:nuclear transport factor 2 family protein [Sulfurovum sp.]